MSTMVVHCREEPFDVYIGSLKSAVARLIADKTFRKVVTHTLPPRTDKEWRDHLFGELRRFGLDPHWYIRG